MIVVRRRAEAPAPRDVREALEEDFFGKCYLCESHCRTAQIEHLKPQSAFPELRDAWSNKFLACGGSCNQRRLHWEKREEGTMVDGKRIRWPKGGMLDPSLDEDLEWRLVQAVDRVGGFLHAVFMACDPADLSAVNTALELQVLHEGRQGREICARIQDWKGQLDERLCSFYEAPPEPTSERQRIAANIRAMLTDAAPYAGLMRAELRRRLADRPHLAERFGLRRAT